MIEYRCQHQNGPLSRLCNHMLLKVAPGFVEIKCKYCGTIHEIPTMSLPEGQIPQGEDHGKSDRHL